MELPPGNGVRSGRTGAVAARSSKRHVDRNPKGKAAQSLHQLQTAAGGPSFRNVIYGVRFQLLSVDPLGQVTRDIARPIGSAKVPL
jgi:hypothetical protein